MMKLFKKTDILVLSIIFLFIAIYYSRLFTGFFQQDEWYGFGWYILHKDLGFWQTIQFYFAPSIGHYNPLSIALQQILFSAWGMNYDGFLVIGILLHFVSAALVFYLTKKIFKGDATIAFCTALLFALFAAPYQGAGWVVANIATGFATLAGIVSAILFLEFLDSKKDKYFVASIVFFGISILFKEITLGLLPLYLFTYLLKMGRKSKRKYVGIILVTGLIYVVFRFTMLFGPNMTGDKLVTQSKSISVVLYDFVTIPIKSISNTLLPTEFIKNIALKFTSFFPSKLTGLAGTPDFEIFAVKRVMEVINVFVGIGVILVSLWVGLSKKNKEYRVIIFFSLGWIILNSFILALAPELNGHILVIDSRNLYFPAIGVALLVVILIKIFSRHSYGKFFIIILALLIFNMYWLNRNLTNFSEMGQVRSRILTKMTAYYPRLPSKVIIYTESDTSYYGLPETAKILPFQSGFGQTLLVWYEPVNKFPTGFFENNFLWDIESQGYKEIGENGFGYFRDYYLLIKKIKEYNLPEESVIAFSWKSGEGTFIDISSSVRKRIEKDVKGKN